MIASEADWHAWRAEGWGASDIAAAWTGRYGSAYRVVARKAGRLVDDVSDSTRERMRRGHDFEPRIARMVHEATGWHVIGEQMPCEHPDQPRYRCTVDGFVAERVDTMLGDAIGPVEFKTHGVDVRPAWDYYDAQIQWQLLVTQFQRGVLAVATVDDSTMQVVGFRLSIVDADPLLQASLITLAEQLDDHLRDGTLPRPDGSDLVTAAVRAVTWTASPDDAQAVDLGDLAAQVARLVDVKADIAVAKREQAEIENVLADRIGYSAHGVADPFVVTYSRPRRVLNEQAVLDAYPALGVTVLDRKAADAHLGKTGLDEFREPLGARTLTVRRMKGTGE